MKINSTIKNKEKGNFSKGEKMVEIIKKVLKIENVHELFQPNKHSKE